MWLLPLLLLMLGGGEARSPEGSAGWDGGKRGNPHDLSIQPTWEPHDSRHSLASDAKYTDPERKLYQQRYPADASHFFAVSPLKKHHQKERQNKAKRYHPSQHRNKHQRLVMNEDIVKDNEDSLSHSSFANRGNRYKTQHHGSKYHERLMYKDGFAVLSPVRERKSRPSINHQRLMYRFGMTDTRKHSQSDDTIPSNPKERQIYNDTDNDNNNQEYIHLPLHKELDYPLQMDDHRTHRDHVSPQESKSNEEKTSLYDLVMNKDSKGDQSKRHDENIQGHISHISKRASTQASAERAEDQMPFPEGTPEAKFILDTGKTPANPLFRNISLDSRLAYRSPAMYLDDRKLSMLRASEKPKTQEQNETKEETEDKEPDSLLVTPPGVDHTIPQAVVGDYTTTVTEQAKKSDEIGNDLTPSPPSLKDSLELVKPEPNSDSDSNEDSMDDDFNLSPKHTEIEIIEPLPEFSPIEKASSGDVEEDTKEETPFSNVHKNMSTDLTQNHPPHNEDSDDENPFSEAAHDSKIGLMDDIDDDLNRPSLDYIPEYEESVPSSPGQEDVKEYGAEHKVMYAQPEPDWVKAKHILGAAWQVHIYGVGVAFVLLSMYSLISLLRLCQHKNLLSQGFFLSLNIMMLFLGFFRATYFLVDGYNTNSTFHPVGAYFLHNIAFPCLLSSFSIIFLALLQSTRTFILSPNLQRSKYLVLIIVCHFVFSNISDLVVGLVLKAKAMMFVSQLITVTWGIFLFAGYIYVFTKLHMATVWRQKEMMRHILAKVKVNVIAPITMQPRLTLSLAIKVTLVASILGLMLMAWLIYGMASINGIFSTRVPTAWAWWGYTFGLRVLEILLCITISYVGTQPFRYNQSTSEKSWHWIGMFYLAPCQHICCGDDQALDINDEDLDWCDLPGDNMGSPGHLNNMTGAINQVIINPEEGVPFNQQGLPLTAYGNTIHSINSDKTLSLKKPASRPASLLINDNGFVRFRQDGEEGGDICLSTDDELDGPDVPRTTPNEIKQCAIVHTPSNPEPPDIKSKPLDDYPPGSLTDIEEYYTYPKSMPLKRKKRRRKSMLLSGSPPGTPASFLSATDCDGVSMWSFRPPSSIHLKDSIENVLNYRGIDIRTPDYLESPLGSHRPTRERLNKSLHSLGSMTELQSLRDYFIKRFLSSNQQPQDVADLTKSYDFDDFSIDPIAEDSDAASLKSAQSHYARSNCDLDLEPRKPRLGLRGHLKVKGQDEDVPFTLEDVCP